MMATTLKEKAFSVVQKRNLTSYMNSTKWNELRYAVLNDELPFHPPFIVKTLFDDATQADNDFLKGDVWYLGDWYEGLTYYDSFPEISTFNMGFLIEYIKVRPRYLKNRGALIAPEVVSCEDEFVSILNRYNIYFELKDGIYTIYGYK